ncbi:MAG: 7-carboxy-7-deazaguanine synthase QueE [Dysgonamonadaceae bacterium]|jgi:organic radical activating enzyme|nr:7-carboxy-7-deazaguanine synthase QueE [Dysgonamonadaceae bacterium]
MSLKIKEIFYSLQGEGGRTGEASIFIRLAGCNLKCEFCDTDFSGGTEMELTEIHQVIKKYPCRWIIWTGGEPALQLTDEILAFFKSLGYKQAIESNGILPLSQLLDYKAVSPKGNVLYAKKANPIVDEIRMPVQKGDNLPEIEDLPEAKRYFVSPIFAEKRELTDGKLSAETRGNIAYCVELALQNPQWTLSLQTHKLINIE